MSAIGYSGTGRRFNDKTAAIISAHADFRLEDYFFPRTQSLSLSRVKWESRIEPLHSWSELILYGTGIVLVALAVFMCLQ